MIPKCIPLTRKSILNKILIKKKRLELKMNFEFDSEKAAKKFSEKKEEEFFTNIFHSDSI
jgi:hypothetical protein